MTISKLLIGAAALTLLAFPAFAADTYAGGAIMTMNIDGKNVLTDAKGMTLYTFDKDTAGQASTCAGKCAAAWPPLYAAAGATAAGDFTLVKSADGKDMWAYKGLPLYTWVKDTKPGDDTGEGVGNVWHTALDKD